MGKESDDSEDLNELKELDELIAHKHLYTNAEVLWFKRWFGRFIASHGEANTTLSEVYESYFSWLTAGGRRYQASCVTKAIPFFLDNCFAKCTVSLCVN